VFDFLLVINSNLGPILHRLATIHPLQRTMDNNCARHLQHCCSWTDRETDSIWKNPVGI